jgi:hypothetical protein
LPIGRLIHGPPEDAMETSVAPNRFRVSNREVIDCDRLGVSP